MLLFKNKKEENKTTIQDDPQAQNQTTDATNQNPNSAKVDDFDLVQSDEKEIPAPKIATKQADEPLVDQPQTLSTEHKVGQQELTTEKSDVQKENILGVQPITNQPLLNKQLQIAYLLGTTEDQLRKDFYKFQLSLLLKKLGSFPDARVNSYQTAEEYLLSNHKKGISEYIVSPLEFSVFKSVCKKRRLKELKFWVLSDGLKGEGSFKGRFYAVKALSKGGADCIVYPFPMRADGFSLLGENKRRAGKTVKASRKPVVLALESTQIDGFTKTVRAVEGVKADGFMLCADDPLSLQSSSALEILNKHKDGRNLYIKCYARSAQDFSSLATFKANRIFTPFADNIVKEISLILGVD